MTDRSLKLISLYWLKPNTEEEVQEEVNKIIFQRLQTITLKVKTQIWIL